MIIPTRTKPGPSYLASPLRKFTSWRSNFSATCDTTCTCPNLNGPSGNPSWANLERFSKPPQRFRTPTLRPLSHLLPKASHTNCRHPRPLTTVRTLIRRLDQQPKVTNRCQCLTRQHPTYINLLSERSIWSRRTAREVWTQQAISRLQNGRFIQNSLRVEPL